jgi:hypothetical protein
VLNQLTEYQRKELKKSEILTYARRNKIPIFPPQTSEKKTSYQPTKQASVQPKKTAPQPTKKVVPPPPPPVQELLPKPTQEKEIQLNIDVLAMVGKMNMTVPVKCAKC